MAEKITPGQAQTLVNMIRKFLQEMIEPLDLELAAYTALVVVIKQGYPALAQEIDGALASLMTQPALVGIMHQKYHASLEPILQRFVSEIRDIDDLDEFFRNWKPGPIN
jgi:hypothetical protein